MNGHSKSTKCDESKSQPFGKHIPRRHCIPVLYTTGTHYEVGFDMVK